MTFARLDIICMAGHRKKVVAHLFRNVENGPLTVILKDKAVNDNRMALIRVHSREQSTNYYQAPSTIETIAPLLPNPHSTYPLNCPVCPEAPLALTESNLGWLLDGYSSSGVSSCKLSNLRSTLLNK